MDKLKIIDLTKSYGKLEVLKDFNLTIKVGEIVAMIGVNGSGKSTLIEILCGVKKSNSGTIIFDGHSNFDRKFNAKLKYELGYMPQSFSLFNDLTVKENIEYLYAVYSIQDKNRVQEIIDKCYLSGKEKQLAKNLSGGFKQLLSLAAATINEPKLLILDEPTSAMDPLFRKQFWSIIHDCNLKGTTVLVTTHYMEEIFECQKLVCLSEGKIVFESDIGNLIKSDKFSTVEELLNKYIIKEKI
ncbi:MAG: ABC transporter ATP-binding protein [Clostridia bacterium]|nr:ABC transporter ATP-binding protein [Clostridia bacterium]